jgi:dephospho-CoA kinase
MLKVGLTGGIATGKSHILSLLRELGCEVCDADEFAHAAIAPGAPAYHEVVREFGPEVLAGDGTIDRARLGRDVFADPERRARLNAIVHPRVYEAQKRWFDEVEERNPDAIAVVDAALLIETGSWRRFDFLVVVYCMLEQQIERLMSRNHLSREDALARIDAQMPTSEKLKYADYTIDTSAGYEHTRIQVEKLYERLQKELKS